MPPGALAAPDADRASSEEPETVSLRDIETIVSPGKVPPRLPATSARLVGGKGGAPPLARSVTRSLGTSSSPPRFGSDPAKSVRPAAPLSDLPPPSVERPPPNPLESSAADLELMAAMAAVPSKRPTEQKPEWAPPKPPVQARAATVAVLSSEAAAALRGSRPGVAPSVGAWRPTPGAAPGAGPTTGPSAGPGPSPTRSPTLRSIAVPVERPAAAGKPAVVVPPPPVRVGPPQRKSVTDASEIDASWDSPEDDAPPDPPARTSATNLPAFHHHGPPPLPARAERDTRAVDALAMRGGTRASLPDPVELLRDAPSPMKATGRGSVVDPLELYGAVSPAVPRQNESALPKVMVQVPPARAPMESDAERTAAAIMRASAKAAAALSHGDGAGAEGLDDAEQRAADAAAEAKGAFRPRVDLPPRVEPRPFPKAPPRKPEPRPAAGELPAIAKADAAHAPAARIEARPVAALRVPPTPAVPGAPRGATPAPSAADQLDDDEIQVDITPDPPEPEISAPPRSDLPAGPISDSGRFDLQQLMSAGPKSLKPSQKGLGDADLFGLAGDLFHDGAPGKIAPMDLHALGTRGASLPPQSTRLLAPVAVGPAPAATERQAVPRAVAPAVAPESKAPSTERRAAGARSFTPWLLLPVAAMAGAVLMVWTGRDSAPSGQAVATASGAPTAPAPTETAPPPPSSTAPVAAPTSSDKPDTKTEPAPTASGSAGTTGGSGVWKPPSSGTGTGAPPGGTPSVTAPPVATTPPVATAPTATAPTATAPAATGGEFNATAAKAALRNAAGGAAGCPSDKPGVATVSITFAPSGRVTSSQVSGTFAGTTTGGCIAAAMRSASVPPFEGGPVSVVWKVTLR